MDALSPTLPVVLETDVTVKTRDEVRMAGEIVTGNDVPALGRDPTV